MPILLRRYDDDDDYDDDDFAYNDGGDHHDGYDDDHNTRAAHTHSTPSSGFTSSGATGQRLSSRSGNLTHNTSGTGGTLSSGRLSGRTEVFGDSQGDEDDNGYRGNGGGGGGDHLGAVPEEDAWGSHPSAAAAAAAAAGADYDDPTPNGAGGGGGGGLFGRFRRGRVGSTGGRGNAKSGAEQWLERENSKGGMGDDGYDDDDDLQESSPGFRAAVAGGATKAAAAGLMGGITERNERGDGAKDFSTARQKQGRHWARILALFMATVIVVGVAVGAVLGAWDVGDGGGDTESYSIQGGGQGQGQGGGLKGDQPSSSTSSPPPTRRPTTGRPSAVPSAVPTATTVAAAPTGPAPSTSEPSRRPTSAPNSEAPTLGRTETETATATATAVPAPGPTQQPQPAAVDLAALCPPDLVPHVVSLSVGGIDGGALPSSSWEDEGRSLIVIVRDAAGSNDLVYQERFAGPDEVGYACLNGAGDSLDHSGCYSVSAAWLYSASDGGGVGVGVGADSSSSGWGVRWEVRPAPGFGGGGDGSAGGSEEEDAAPVPRGIVRSDQEGEASCTFTSLTTSGGVVPCDATCATTDVGLGGDVVDDGPAPPPSLSPPPTASPAGATVTAAPTFPRCPKRRSLYQLVVVREDNAFARGSGEGTTLTLTKRAATGGEGLLYKSTISEAEAEAPVYFCMRTRMCYTAALTGEPAEGVRWEVRPVDVGGTGAKMTDPIGTGTADELGSCTFTLPGQGVCATTCTLGGGVGPAGSNKAGSNKKKKKRRRRKKNKNKGGGGQELSPVPSTPTIMVSLGSRRHGPSTPASSRVPRGGRRAKGGGASSPQPPLLRRTSSIRHRAQT